MSKYFKTKEDFNNWISAHTSFNESLFGKSEEQYVQELVNEGYTDLDNLLEDGHRYEIAGHTNNGWIYKDEADMEHIKFNNVDVEIRER